MRWMVVSDSGIVYCRGSLIFCRSYLRQAVRRGFRPGSLMIRRVGKPRRAT